MEEKERESMKPLYDLHVHTNYSDGSCTTEEIMKEAEDLGLKAIAITDHENVDAHLEIREKGTYSFRGQVIPGVEMRTSSCGMIIEILGFGIDPFKMKERLNGRYKSKEEEDLYLLQKAYKKYQEMGIRFPAGFVQDYNYQKYPWVSAYIINGILQNEENRKIVGEDLFQTPKIFYRRYLTNPDSELFCDLTEIFPTPQEVIDMIHEAGGVSLLAHYSQYFEKKYDIVDEMLNNYNIDGFESYYSYFTEEDTKYMQACLAGTDYLRSGGSDYHGTQKPKIHLGVGLGNLCIQREDIAALLTYLGL